MFGFSTDMMISLLRHLLTFIAGLIVAKGWVTADQASELAGGIVAIAGVLFAMFFHATSNGAVTALSTTPNAGNLVNAGNKPSGA